jgi:E3 ubiquitin-protein ligase SIAH1
VERHCKFREYGCEETVKLTKAHAHEESCPFAVYDCPFNGCECQENGLQLFKNVEDDHADEVARINNLRSTKVTVSMAAAFRVLVQPGTHRMYLLVGGDVLGGRCLTLVCLGPRGTSSQWRCAAASPTRSR